MRLILICLVATVGVALAKPQGYDFPSRNSGYDSNDRQGYGGGNNDRQGYGGGSNDRPGYGGGNNDRQGYGGGSGGYPDRQVAPNQRPQYTVGSVLDNEMYSNNGGGYSSFNRTDFYPNNAAVNRVQNFYPSSSPASIGTTTTQSNRFGSTAFDRNFQQGSSTARPTGQGNFRPTGNAGFGATNNQFGNRPQFGSSGAGIGGFTTTNRPGVQQQQQQFAGNFDGNSGFGATGVSGFAGNNPNNNFVSTTSQRPFPDSINSQLPDSPVVNANFPGNAGFVNSAVNSGRPTTTNAPFAINNGGAPFSRPNNNNNGFGGSGSGNTRPFTGSNTRPFNGGNTRPFNGDNTRPFAGNNDRFGNNNNRPPFGAGSGGNSGFGNNGGNNGGFPVNSNNLNNDDLSEPANYEFSYEVNDPPSGQNFGHTERRQGDDTSGSYFVLLPDGRLQRVDYTAGVGGYRARVTYEDQGGQFRK